MSTKSYQGSGRVCLRPTKSGSTCGTCQNLRLDKQTDTKQVIKIDAFDLAESADEGYCKWCSLVYRSLMELGAELPAPGKSAFARIVAQRSKPFYVEWISQQQSRITAEIYQIVGDGPRIPELGYATKISPEITSDTVFTQISSWLQRCEEDHNDCFRDTASAPRRLLDIRDPLQEAKTRTIRLVQDIQEPVKYIALSHCWGKSQNLTTTAASLEHRMMSISWDELPKTYQDAITVAQKLSLRYIWIDSLCILQDGELDWATESSKMSGIYEDSYLTLAAALAPGDDSGFLNPSPWRQKFLGAPLDLSDYGIHENTLWSREIHDNRTLQSYQWLASRAWTLQESLILRRLLTFSVTVCFECRSAQLCESGNGLSPDPFCGNHEDFKRIDRAECAKMLEGPVNDHEVYRYWYKNHVAPYSTRELTKLRDRLPALSGLASKFSLRLKDNYLAGLWERDLITGLAWTTLQPGRNLPDRAPSWSWASVEGPISPSAWEPRSVDMSLEVLDVQVTTNPDGVVQKGSFRVSGMMCTAFLDVEPLIISEEYSNLEHAHYKYSLIREGFESERDAVTFADVHGGPGLMLDTPLSVGVSSTSNSEALYPLQRSLDGHFPRAEKVSGTVLCVLLYEYHIKYRQRPKRTYLVLGASSTEPGVFFRLGIFKPLLRDSNIWFEDMNKDVITIR